MKRDRGNTAQVMIRIHPELKRELDAYCEEKRVTITELMRRLIEEEVKKKGQTEK